MGSHGGGWKEKSQEEAHAGEKGGRGGKKTFSWEFENNKKVINEI